MHELSLADKLVQKILTIAQEEHAVKIVGVKIRLGALVGISSEHFREHIVRAVTGTIAEKTRIEIKEMGFETSPEAQDIILESIEMESPDAGTA